MERTVLICDDSPTMRQLIAFALRRLPSVKILEAENGSVALELLATSPADVVLLDINMPVMNGFAFLEALQTTTLPRKPPVIMITTEGADNDMARAKALGVAGYVTKPIQAARLATTVEEVLSRP